MIYQARGPELNRQSFRSTAYETGKSTNRLPPATRVLLIVTAGESNVKQKVLECGFAQFKLPVDTTTKSAWSRLNSDPWSLNYWVRVRGTPFSRGLRENSVALAL